MSQSALAAGCLVTTPPTRMCFQQAFLISACQWAGFSKFQLGLPRFGSGFCISCFWVSGLSIWVPGYSDMFSLTFCSFKDKILLCSLGCFRTRGLPASASQVNAGVKERTTTPDWACSLVFCGML